jgi:hypothetical protein
MSRPYYAPEGTDLDQLFRMDCPDCRASVRVKRNAVGVFIADHLGKYNTASVSSNRPILPADQRPDPD